MVTAVRYMDNTHLRSGRYDVGYYRRSNLQLHEITIYNNGLQRIAAARNAINSTKSGRQKMRERNLAAASLPRELGVNASLVLTFSALAFINVSEHYVCFWAIKADNRSRVHHVQIYPRGYLT
ncbi:unnamed protein product [Nezara viridula]|uniref:Uncharacterized protein n=1 Tax=Nezara viridula TaxID=85310 RepID=A0A9P0E1Y2_NEZVI|nr:unnamed protein product [Nezara viridula]